MLAIRKRFKKDLFFTIYAYSLMSIVLVIFFSLITNIYYFRLLAKDTEEKYRQSLKEVSASLNTSMREILETAALISAYEEFNKLFFYPGKLVNGDYSSFYRSQQTLSRFRSAKDSLVHSAFIVLPNEDRIISNYGSSTINEFVEITHMSDNYGDSFWRELSYGGESFMILPPDNVRNDRQDKDIPVLPFVIFQTENRLFSNPFVIDLKLQNLADLLENGRHTPNSILFIEDKDGNILISTSGGTLREPGRRDLIITYRDEQSTLSDWQFTALVPYGDLVRDLLNRLAVPLIILIVSLISSTFLAYVLSGRIYSPIGKIISGFRRLQPGSAVYEDKGELEYLSREINRIIEDRDKFSHELSQAVPYGCERFFLSLLNGESQIDEGETKLFLEDYDISFSKPAYLVVLTSINFDSRFYKDYTRDDHNRICTRILRAFRDFPHEDLPGYHFLMSAERICSIFNLDKDVTLTRVSSHISQIHGQLNLNDQPLTLTSGIGLICDNLTELKRSYREAADRLSRGILGKTGGVEISSPAGGTISPAYTMEEENILFNLLLKGEKKETLEFIEGLENRGIGKGAEAPEMNDLYRQLYNTGKRVLSLRNMSDYDLMGEEYVNISGGRELPLSFILRDYVILLLTRLMDSSRSKRRHFDVDNLKHYLNDHYQEDLYLDKIGEDFGVSPKHASRLIKQELGMSFQKYISRLRISRAKELLETTDKSIEEIALETGFNSRYPFLRMFKILEGLTPSEYRKEVVPQLKKPLPGDSGL